MTRMDDAVARDLTTAPAAPPIGSIEARARRTRRRRWTATVVLVVVALMTSAVVVASLGRKSSGPGISVSPTTAPARTVVCIHHPVARGSDYFGPPALHGTPIDYHPSQTLYPVDSEGNTIKADGPSLVKQGPSGIITLESHDPGGVVYLGFGDFDGDGRSDLLVATFAQYKPYVVPGTLRTGTYDPAVVGFPVPHPRIDDFVAAVGDQNRDGADDISVGAALYSGRKITAKHAQSSRIRPFRVLPAPPRGLLQIDSGGALPSFVLPHVDRDSRALFDSLDVLDRHSDRLVLDGLTSEEKDLLAGRIEGVPYGAATGWLANGHHIVDFAYSDRDGGRYWRFDLDAPCAS